MMNPQLKRYYFYVFVSVAICLGLQAMLPFPYGMIVSLLFMMALPAFIRFFVYKRMNNAGRFGGLEDRKLQIICMVCGYKTREPQCPRCGSKQFSTA